MATYPEECCELSAQATLWLTKEDLCEEEFCRLKIQESNQDFLSLLHTELIAVEQGMYACGGLSPYMAAYSVYMCDTTWQIGKEGTGSLKYPVSSPPTGFLSLDRNLLVAQSLALICLPQPQVPPDQHKKSFVRVPRIVVLLLEKQVYPIVVLRQWLSECM